MLRIGVTTDCIHCGAEISIVDETCPYCKASTAESSRRNRRWAVLSGVVMASFLYAHVFHDGAGAWALGSGLSVIGGALVIIIMGRSGSNGPPKAPPSSP